MGQPRSWQKMSTTWATSEADEPRKTNSPFCQHIGKFLKINECSACLLRSKRSRVSRLKSMQLLFCVQSDQTHIHNCSHIHTSYIHEYFFYGYRAQFNFLLSRWMFSNFYFRISHVFDFQGICAYSYAPVMTSRLPNTVRYETWDMR